MDRLQQAYKDGVVMGLKDVNGPEPVDRLDIDVLLYYYPDTFNLLLIAFKELKGEEDICWEIDDRYDSTKADWMYWSQIAGIHGLPSHDWDGETGRNPDKEKGGGYCAHGTPLFGPWHRPYLAMLEQSLYRQAANIVERFERSTILTQDEKQTYRNALKQLRLPYWDYFRPRAGGTTFTGIFNDNKTHAPYDFHVPWICTQPQVMIKSLPDNKLVLMDNPFYNYKFVKDKFGHEDLSDNDWRNSKLNIKYQDRTKTIRWGDNGEESIRQMNLNINKIREDNMRTMLLMIEDQNPQGYPNFQNFSTDGVGKIDDPFPPGMVKRYGSIENLHGTYHVYAGGFLGDKFEGTDKSPLTGHLLCVPVASFDPLFWLHHCQIDRLFAIWQAVNPTHWFEDLVDVDGTKEWKDLHSKHLYPFRKPPLRLERDHPERFWTADTARYTEAFGYTYPDIPRKMSTAEIRDIFRQRYKWSVRPTPKDVFRDPPQDMLPLDLSQAQVFRYTEGSPILGKVQQTISSITDKISGFAEAAKASVLVGSEPKVSYEWFIDFVVERMAMNNAFTIFFVLEDISGSTGTDWGSKPGFIGASHIFASPREACDNCGRQEEQGILVSGTVAMASLLFDYVKRGQPGDPPSLDVADIKPFLEKNLKWRVQTVDGRVVNPRELARHHSFRLGISVRITSLVGEEGEVRSERVDDIIAHIIENSS